MKRNQIGLILMVLAAALLASGTILMKMIPQVTNLQPKDVAIWRFSIATPLFWLFYIIKNKGVQKAPGSVWGFLGLGCVFAFASFCAIFALSKLSSSLYIIIVYIFPSLVVLYSLLSGGRVPTLYWLGLPGTLIGLLLISFQFNSDMRVDPIGLLITIVNAFAMAAYFILSEHLFRNIQNKMLSTTWVMTGAMAACLSTISFLGIQTPDSLRGWLLLIALSFFGTLFPVIATNFGLQMLGAARGSIIVTLQPVLTVLYSTLFLSDKLSSLQWVGGVLVIAAVVMLQLSPDRSKKRSLSN